MRDLYLHPAGKIRRRNSRLSKLLRGQCESSIRKCWRVFRIGCSLSSRCNNGAMRVLMTLLISGVLFLPAQTREENDAAVTGRILFNRMAAHDAAMIRSSMPVDARVYSAQDEMAPTGRAGEEFVNRIAATKSDLCERVTQQAKILIRGRMARSGTATSICAMRKFNLRGVDSINIFKTSAGWRIATITYAVATIGCEVH